MVHCAPGPWSWYYRRAARRGAVGVGRVCSSSGGAGFRSALFRMASRGCCSWLLKFDQRMRRSRAGSRGRALPRRAAASLSPGTRRRRRVVSGRAKHSGFYSFNPVTDPSQTMPLRPLAGRERPLPRPRWRLRAGTPHREAAAAGRLDAALGRVCDDFSQSI